MGRTGRGRFAGRQETGPVPLAICVLDQLGGDLPGLPGSHEHDDLVQVATSGVGHEADRLVIALVDNGNHDSAMDNESPGRLRLR